MMQREQVVLFFSKAGMKLDKTDKSTSGFWKPTKNADDKYAEPLGSKSGSLWPCPELHLPIPISVGENCSFTSFWLLPEIIGFSLEWRWG